MYTFPPDVNSVLLRVTSSDLSCTVVSVQKIQVRGIIPLFVLDSKLWLSDDSGDNVRNVDVLWVYMSVLKKIKLKKKTCARSSGNG